jgi:transcriptional regulator with XRE-family HTH domain
MAQEGWQTRLTSTVAAQIRLYRQMHQMSTQDLADRCAELGFAIPRPVLSNLENGRRESVSVAELIVLARALQTSPLQLAMPVGRQETIELTPGEQVAVWDAARWFTGELWLDHDPPVRTLLPGWAPRVDPADPLTAFRRHDALVAAWYSYRSTFARPDPGDPAAQPGPTQRMQDVADEEMQRVEADLRHLRQRMRQHELIPPPLPPELERVEMGGPAAPTRIRDLRHSSGRSSADRE